MPHITITLTVTLCDPMPDFDVQGMAQEMQDALGTIVLDGTGYGSAMVEVPLIGYTVPFNQVAPE